MDDEPYASYDEAAEDRGRELAQEVIEKLDLTTFIRSWNAGDPYTSYIASVIHLNNALDFDNIVSKHYDDFCRIAKSENCEVEFLIWLSTFLTDSIISSLVQGLLTMSQAWARALIEQPPAAFGAPAPFRDIDVLIDWCLAHVERPPIAGPSGETILSIDVEDNLLRQALYRETATALRSDWFRSHKGS